MNGELAQAIALVAHGNAALVSGVELRDFEERYSTFQYVTSVSFDASRTWRRSTPARSVAEWTNRLQRASMSQLVLVIGGALPQHAGFANAGSNGIVGLGRGCVAGWYASWEVNREGVDPDDLRPKIWEVSYQLFERRGGMDQRKGPPRTLESDS